MITSLNYANFLKNISGSISSITPAYESLEMLLIVTVSSRFFLGFGRLLSLTTGIDSVVRGRTSIIARPGEAAE